MLLLGVGQEVVVQPPVVVDHSGETWQFGQVRGVSTTEVGVYGYTDASEHCGVFGHSPAGIGVKGASNGTDGVQGWTSAPNASGVFGYSYVAPGVTGWSSGNDGLVGISISPNPDHAALRARNEGSGPAIVCEGDLIVTGAIQGGGISQFLDAAAVEDIEELVMDLVATQTELGTSLVDVQTELDHIEDKLCHFIEEFAKELGEALYGNEDAFLGIVPLRCNVFTRVDWPTLEPIKPAIDQLEAKLDLFPLDLDESVGKVLDELDTVLTRLREAQDDIMYELTDIVENLIADAHYRLYLGLGKLEVKLDVNERAMSALAGTLGELIVGQPIPLDPIQHGPWPWGGMNLFGLVSALEAKLDGMQTDLATIGARIGANALGITANGNAIAYVLTAVGDNGSAIRANAAAIDSVLVATDTVRAAVAANGDAIASLETKAHTAAAERAEHLAAINRVQSTVDDNRTAMVDVFDQLASIDATLLATADTVQELADQAEANSSAVAENTRTTTLLTVMMESLLDSSSRIEDRVNRQLGLPQVPDASKIALTIRECSLPDCDLLAVIEGQPGAVEGGAYVTIYFWPGGEPLFMLVQANPDGSFSEVGKAGTLPDGVTPVSSLLWIEVSQKRGEDADESARARLFVSPESENE